MLAFVGFASVYANRGQLPIQALKAHIADSGQQNSALPPLLPTHLRCWRRGSLTEYSATCDHCCG